MFRKKRGTAEVIALYVLSAIWGTLFSITVANGTFKKQMQKIKDAHNAPITVDKDLNEGNKGNF